MEPTGPDDNQRDDVGKKSLRKKGRGENEEKRNGDLEFFAGMIKPKRERSLGDDEKGKATGKETQSEQRKTTWDPNGRTRGGGERGSIGRTRVCSSDGEVAWRNRAP